MSRKLFRLLALVALFCMIVSGATVSAGSSHRLNYFQTGMVEKDGREILRIEIGMNGDDLKYDVVVKPYLKTRMNVVLKDTRPGKLDRDIRLKNDIVKRVQIQELEEGVTQVRVHMENEVEEGSYEVYTLPSDKRAKKPYRLVIDIGKSSSGSGGGKIEGVAGHALVLDAGHGGSDSGAIGPSGLTEKEVALSVTKKVQAYLQGAGARVIMTREDDRDVYGINATDRQELQARVNVGLYAPETEIFVSIHCNAFSNPNAHGMETYHYAGSYRGQRLAQLLNEELEAAGGLTNRGVKSANFYVIKYSKVPASLVELGFITNYREEALLGSDEYQDKLALAIAKAIGRYFQEH